MKFFGILLQYITFSALSLITLLHPSCISACSVNMLSASLLSFLSPCFFFFFKINRLFLGGGAVLGLQKN